MHILRHYHVFVPKFSSITIHYIVHITYFEYTEIARYQLWKSSLLNLFT